jgi:hypothetical protein
MLTYRERYAQASSLPSDSLFDQRNEETAQYRAADPYNITQSELAAMQVLDLEIGRHKQAKLCTPLPIPSRTGYSYSDWCKQKQIKSAMGKAITCLSMRVSQRQFQPSTPTKRRSYPPFP